MTYQNHRLRLSVKYVADALHVALHRDLAGGCPIAPMTGQVQSNRSMPGPFQKWDDFVPAPCPMPRAMDQYVGTHCLAPFRFPRSISDSIQEAHRYHC